MPKWLVAFLTVLALMAVGFSLWFFAVRDSWEADNALRIRRQCESTIVSANSDNSRLAAQELKILQSLIGNRTIRDEELKMLVINAVAAGTKAAARYEAEQLESRNKALEPETRRQLIALEKQAEKHEQGQDFIQAIAKCEEGLKLIESRGINDTVFRDERTRFASTIERVQKLAKERAAEAVLAKSRAARSTQFADIKARIRGGAWVTRKSGTSDVLRGLEVVALPGWLPNAAFISMYEANLATAKDFLARARENLAATESIEAKRPGAFADILKGDKEIVSIRESQVRRWQERLASAQARQEDLQNLLLIVLMQPERPSQAESRALINLLTKHKTALARTDIDGKYDITVSGGDVCLMAVFETEVARMMWCVSVDVDSSNEKSIDLHNANAIAIWNKGD